jgi:HK97 family phage major capsid protein
MRTTFRWIGSACGLAIALLLMASVFFPDLSAQLMAHATPSVSPLHNFLAALTEPSGAGGVAMALGVLAAPFTSRVDRLAAKVEAVTAQMRGIHEAAGDEPLSAEQTAKWEALKGERDALTAAHGQATAQVEFERTAPAVSVSPGNGDRVVVGKDRAADQPWAESGGLGAFLIAVKRAAQGRGTDPRLMAAASGMGEAIGPDGGFAVPIEYGEDIEKQMWDTGVILSRVSQRPISGNAMTFNVINETSRVDGSRRGGVLGYWLDEGDAPTKSAIKIARVELKLRKVGAIGYMSDELTEDAPALEAELREAFAEELQFRTEDAIVNGLGATQPLGFLQAPCLVTVAKETNQAAATIKTTNLSKMWSRMPARSKANAAWLINVDAEPQLDELTIPAGTGAVEPRFVTYGPDGLLRIKGRPVIAVEYCATVGTVGDICLVDLSQYRLIRKASGVRQDSSMHVRFLNDEQTFRAIYRVDGQPLPRAAITPFKGSNTLSPFVALATRS